MTVKIQEPALSDRLLRLFGRRRAVRFPVNAYRTFGPYVYVRAPREGFWRALVRRRGGPPPEGWFYPEDIHAQNERRIAGEAGDEDSAENN